MRWLIWVLVIAACDGGQGALLVFHGSGSAARVEVILASPETLSVDQRIAAGRPEMERVRYFKQASTGGDLTNVTFDGTMIRIERTQGSPDTFVPLVVAYNDASELIGIGTIGDGPDPVTIPADQIEQYDVNIETLEARDDGIVLPGKAVVVLTDGVVSGFAWKFTHHASREQLRVVLAQPGSIDAADLPFDLDHDQHPADPDDCDDLHMAFHAGATELCGDPDLNCDGQPSPATLACTTAMSQCSGTKCGVTGGCNPNPSDPNCRCEINTCTDGGGCRVAATTAAGTSAPCSGHAPLSWVTCDVGPCRVDVKDHPNGWTIGLSVSPQPMLPLSTQVDIAANQQIYLDAISNTATIPTPAAGSVGMVELELTSPNLPDPTRYRFDLSLELTMNGCPSEQGLANMTCVAPGP